MHTMYQSSLVTYCTVRAVMAGDRARDWANVTSLDIEFREETERIWIHHLKSCGGSDE